MELNISVIVLAVVFALIAVRKVAGFQLKIWQIMLGGAAVVLLTMQITPMDALLAINLDVMLFLFGMFIVGEALYQSGYLFHISHRLFKRAKSVDGLILLVLVIVGFFSVFLMNDTLAIIGTPLVLHFASKYNISSKLLLLSLAFAVTIGSALSPIGNPQNLLIAINGGMSAPFVDFFSRLIVPTVINLFLAYLLLKFFFKKEFQKELANHNDDGIKDEKLTLIVKISLVLLTALIAAKIALVFLAPQVEFRLTYIAIISALPIVLFSSRRVEVVRKIDWSTLVFFAALFVLMAAVWNSGFFQSLIADASLDITSIAVIILVSVTVSQFVSNVPFVALYLPLMMEAGASTNEMIALAAGSTIAGNLFILGAASNVIIIQNAEKKGETLTFLEFAKVGAPLTVLNCLVYWAFLTLI
jgi:Na+/H+ antiporter NhaD/arsenite permease-like protein